MATFSGSALSSESTADSAESTADGAESTASCSLLSVLRCPKPSELSRKRKTQKNPPPPLGKCRATRGHGTFDPKSVSPVQRVQEYPGESLSVSNKKVFCNACREEVGLKSSVVSNHIKSTKHKLGKERLVKKEATERDIATAFQTSSQELHPRGETLPEEQRIYRVKVVRVFLRSATPLTKLRFFRELLEENGLRLSDRRQMADIIPFIFAQEQDLIKQELSGKYLSVVFDGTTRFGEAMAIIVRYVDSEWCIQQRLIRLQLLEKSMTGEEIARVLVDTLSREYAVPPGYLLACMRDRASCNNVAVRFLKVMFTRMLDVGCFSHTLDLVGDKICTPHLSEFMLSWLSLFSHSVKAKILWKEQTDRPIRSYCPTRWWSKWECIKQVLELFGDVETFIQRNDDFATATRSKLLTFFSDPRKKALLKAELAVMVDFGVQFVKTTYHLEGDGPLVFRCYEAISALTAAVNLAHYPNLNAIARDLSNSNPANQQQWEVYGKSCVEPAIQYYRERLNSSMKTPLEAFKAARIFSPSKVQEMQVSVSTVDELAAFPFFDTATLAHLKTELPQYIAACAGVDPSYDVCKFWHTHVDTLPHWSAAAAKVAVVQPSSAAAERAFSILKRSFSDCQTGALQDLLETSIMLQFNDRKV